MSSLKEWYRRDGRKFWNWSFAGMLTNFYNERGARNWRSIYSFNRYYLYFFIHILNIYFDQTFFSKRNEMFCNTATDMEYVVHRVSVNVTVSPPNVCKIFCLIESQK